MVELYRRATPLAGLLGAAAFGGLSGAGQPRWTHGAAVTVVIAAEGYPGTPAKGDQIDGIEQAERVAAAYILHAGTSAAGDGRLVSSGGRVLNVVGTGADLAGARSAAYEGAGKIRMRGGGERGGSVQGAPARP